MTKKIFVSILKTHTPYLFYNYHGLFRYEISSLYDDSNPCRQGPKVFQNKRNSPLLDMMVVQNVLLFLSDKINQNIYE